MRKLLFLIVLLLAIGGNLFAQEAAAGTPDETAEETQPDEKFHVWKEMPWALGASLEFGKEARNDFAIGFGISLDRFLFTPYVALGLRGNLHSSGKDVSATELLLNVRIYLPLANTYLVNASLFTQFGFGVSFFSEEGRKKNTYTMDFIFGSRIYFNRTIIRGFYLEPFFRAGFPFLLSGGLAIGHWFNF